MQRLLQLRKSLKIISLKRDIFHSALQEHSRRRENAYSFLYFIYVSLISKVILLQNGLQIKSALMFEIVLLVICSIIT